ncbi:hypothetical protein HDV02_003599 [Globomyces sp. JEL0801]|nr:hypothetical protein HDV02_003599 [Globomyces sp. JEL0801]
METILQKINNNKPLEEQLDHAADILRKGGLLAETVYGLGANALDSDAVAKIFIAKNRPQDNPLIVHVSDLEMLNSFLAPQSIPNIYLDLIHQEWPGPLTILCEKPEILPLSVSAGQNTVAIRIPAHPVARALIKKCGFPLAAPSANTSGRPSPTLANHVFEEMNGRIPLVIDGGPCESGVESTVLDGLRTPPAILRPGGVTVETIRQYIPQVLVYRKDFVDAGLEAAPSTPGMKYRHYTPNAEVVVVELGADDGALARQEDVLHQQYIKYSTEGGQVGVLKVGGSQYYPQYPLQFDLGVTANEVARNLFNGLRDLERNGANVILVQGITEASEGLAVMNRVRKAATTQLFKKVQTVTANMIEMYKKRQDSVAKNSKINPNMISYLTLSWLLILYLDPHHTTNFLNGNGMYIAILLFALQLALAVFKSIRKNIDRTVQQSIRTTMIGAIYEKSLILSPASKLFFTNGKIMNMINQDTLNLIEAPIIFTRLWSVPVQVIVTFVLLYGIIGRSVFIGVGLMGLLGLFSLLLGPVIGKAYNGWFTGADERISIVREMLYGIKVIKFQCMEEYFWKKIQQARDAQLKSLRKMAVYLSILDGFLFSAPLLLTVITFAVYANDNKLTPSIAFPALAYFNALVNPLIEFADIMSVIPTALKSLQRVNEFLDCEEMEIKKNNIEMDADTDSIIRISNATWEWTNSDVEPPTEKDSSTNFCLKSLNLDIKRGELVGIVGPIGSGKSSLFSGLIGDSVLVDGKVSINGSIAYCSQQSWIISGTIESNILFNTPLDQVRLDEVIEVTGLSKDLTLFGDGLKTKIGESGVNLSGGQKSRVALARALYSDADIYLLDDPIASLDAQVSEHVFTSAIQKYLSKKTVMFVTHQLQFLQKVDRVLVLSGGQIVENGSFDQLREMKNGILYNMISAYRFESNPAERIYETNSTSDIVTSSNAAIDFIEKEDKSERLLDHSQSASYLYSSLQNWLDFRLSVLASMITFSIATLAVNIEKPTVAFASVVGLALTYSSDFALELSMLLMHLGAAESEMNSVERLYHYGHKIPTEAPTTLLKDSSITGWPNRANLTFKDFSVSYPSRPDHLILRNLNFTIKSGEKIGVVGRTGSGKSTLVTALFRVIEPKNDIQTMGLKTLRSQIQIIPQDPVLFEGTLRSNLDYEGNFTDEELWKSLEYVGLKKYVGELEGKLDYEVTYNGDNLSVGQRQLMCLCRSILKSPKILVMDEATASVDGESDQIIQKAISKHFGSTTVISIAHRLNTIAEFDRILVLDNGTVAEFDSPYNLLKNPTSIFSELTDASGPANAALIRELAARKALAI